jgi:hypothetical protein
MSIQQATGDIMTDYQFRSIIKMVLAIARKTTDVNTIIRELEKLLPKDEREEDEPPHGRQ